ncbi:MAG: branched chain amino acid aminotransferase [Lentisphaerae bacterium GWF2_52_8]|nr:MAG: branched chain amino acid aminotransferase [Lentisphaerae bacterium GWF2_52_8]
MKIDWGKLGFSYMPVKSHIRHTYENGAWDKGTLCHEHTITLPIAATCLHYGQAAFEGLKAFRCKDGQVRVFRPDENGERLNMTLRHILAPEVPRELFLEAVRRVVRDNIDFVPPYGTGGSLYIRPLHIGASAQIGIAPSAKYEFIVLVTPVGSYYKGGITPVDALVVEDFDRTAPKGTGHIKVAGNYAASLKPSKIAKEKGFEVALFLDSKTHEYVEEFGTSNFIGITKDGVYVTPDSQSILGSITNKSLMQIAKDLGIPVERRAVHKDELGDFAEIGACGTAVVITPVRRITIGDKTYNYGEACGPILRRLYEEVQGIQYGERIDRHSWMMDI